MINQKPPQSNADNSQQSFNFEAKLTELTQIVEKMEQGNLSLEDALAHFEKGTMLTRQCQKALKEAEQKVQILLEQDGKTVTKPFSTEE